MNLHTFIEDDKEWENELNEIDLEYIKIQEQLLNLKRRAARCHLYKEDSETKCIIEQLSYAITSLL